MFQWNKILIKYSYKNKKNLKDDCTELRETVLSDFHNFEKLRLLKYNAENPKTANCLKQFELDPITKAKYENVTKLYKYICRELPNITSYLDSQKKKTQE